MIHYAEDDWQVICIQDIRECCTWQSDIVDRNIEHVTIPCKKIVSSYIVELLSGTSSLLASQETLRT